MTTIAAVEAARCWVCDRSTCRGPLAGGCDCAPPVVAGAWCVGCQSPMVGDVEAGGLCRCTEPEPAPPEQHVTRSPTSGQRVWAPERVRDGDPDNAWLGAGPGLQHLISRYRASHP